MLDIRIWRKLRGEMGMIFTHLWKPGEMRQRDRQPIGEKCAVERR